MRSILLFIIILNSCKPSSFIQFKQIAQIDLGDTGAAEITAFDTLTKRLFVVNNGGVNKIDVLSFQDLPNITYVKSIDISSYGGFVNSVAVFNGMLAAAIESKPKQDNGSIVLFDTKDYHPVKSFTVGALPDMVTFTSDGKYILCANEGEPSPDYKNDPEGSVSVISIKDDEVIHAGFSIVNAQKNRLISKGFRITGKNEQLKKDTEPEYIAVSKDSKFAWITLQENNAIAKLDITAKEITDVFPLGFKDHSDPLNAMDASDTDGKINFQSYPVKGMFMPDAIGFYEYKGDPFIITANEGDTREYSSFTENKRVNQSKLDAASFPDSKILADHKLGRLIIDTIFGDPDKDGDIDELYSFGTRSFTVWNGNTGQKIWDSHNQLDQLAHQAGYYDDSRSDDRSIEAEGIAIGRINKKTYAFIGMDKADCVAIYEITNPYLPKFKQLLQVGDGPEGILFISKEYSPINKPLLVVGSENDGLIKVFTTNY
jgi:hypothetical protein